MSKIDKSKIRILIVDDHSVVRQGMKHILSQTHDMVVVGEAENGNQALEQVEKIEIDVILMDIEMPGKSGWDTMLQLKAMHPNIRVIILSIFPEDHYGVRLLKAGAWGYLTKQSAPEQMVEAIRKVARGSRFISPALSEKLLYDLDRDKEKAPHEHLSEREFQVFCMLASGKKPSAIAEELGVGVNTISTHKARILEKMNMNSMVELVHYALKNGLIQ